METKTLIGTLTDRHRDHLVIAGVRIEVSEDVSAEQFSIGASLTVVYTLQGDRRIAVSIRQSN